MRSSLETVRPAPARVERPDGASRQGLPRLADGRQHRGRFAMPARASATPWPSPPTIRRGPARSSGRSRWRARSPGDRSAALGPDERVGPRPRPPADRDRQISADSGRIGLLTCASEEVRCDGFAGWRGQRFGVECGPDERGSPVRRTGGRPDSLLAAAYCPLEESYAAIEIDDCRDRVGLGRPGKRWCISGAGRRGAPGRLGLRCRRLVGGFDDGGRRRALAAPAVASGSAPAAPCGWRRTHQWRIRMATMRRRGSPRPTSCAVARPKNVQFQPLRKVSRMLRSTPYQTK